MGARRGGASLSAGRGEDAQPIEGNVTLGRPCRPYEPSPRRQAVISRASGTTTGSSLWRIVMPHFAKASASGLGRHRRIKRHLDPERVVSNLASFSYSMAAALADHRLKA